MLTMSISTGLYPTLDLWNSNKLHYTEELKNAHYFSRDFEAY